jgi:hypothetical protein
VKRTLGGAIVVCLLLFCTSLHAELKVSSTNSRYFVDSYGKAVFLTGSHTWTNFLDGSYTDPPTAFNYAAYLNWLQSYNHNFFRLWTWEIPVAHNTGDAPFYIGPMIFNRPGPGFARDGKPKFDVTSFNQAYFDRLRQRVVDAGNRGMYVSIMLFEGFSVTSNYAALWVHHPFVSENNINGINGDPNNTGSGLAVHTGSIPAILNIQKAYVQKVIDTVNDLDNVLYEICNEGDPSATAWEKDMISVIRTYEATKAKRHPIYFTVPYPNGNNSELFSSTADAIAPNGYGGYDTNPPANNGSKVIIADTDHIWGDGGDRIWAWKSFTRGIQPIFMDGYNSVAGHPFGNPSTDWYSSAFVSLRQNLGYIRTYANKMNLLAMVPHGELASTGYCLANPSQANAEYLVYLPSGGTVTIDLRSTSGSLSVEWFNPSTGGTTTGGSVAGGANRSLTAPFSGDAVLYLLSAYTPPDTAPPSVPTGLQATLISPTNVSFSWTASSDNVGVMGYRVYRNSVLVGSSSSPVFQDSGLAPSTTYQYSVAAYDSAGNTSAQSTVLPVTTLNVAPPVISNVRASSITKNSAVITWTTNTASDAQVDYGRTPSYGSSTILDSNKATTHRVTIQGLARWTTYHYRVKSRNAQGSLATSPDYVFMTKYR